MYLPGMSDIGERIRTLRAARGESLAQLGDSVGLSASAVHQWEAGTTKALRPVNLFAVADHYDVSIRWLVTGEGARQVTETQTDFEHQALRLFRKLTQDGQHAALSHLNWMAAQEQPGATKPSELDPYPGVKKPAPHRR
jgi:transcriptional regulator with XRE-family HTH domain